MATNPEAIKVRKGVEEERNREAQIIQQYLVQFLQEDDLGGGLYKTDAPGK